LIHESNGWLFSRSAFVHHMCGWTLVLGAIFPLGKVFKPRVFGFGAGYALTIIVLAIVLYTSRDVSPIFGHLDPDAGTPHR
jgi:hypothetical protein